MERWPIIAVVTSFIAIVGWLALVPFINTEVSEGAIGLFYAHIIGVALPALIVPVIIALFARPIWPVVVVVGMWLIFGFILIGQHAQTGAAQEVIATAARAAPEAALTAEELHLPFSDSRRTLGSLNALTGIILVYCNLTAGTNGPLFSANLRAAETRPDLPDTYAIATAMAATMSDPRFDRSVRCESH